MRSRMAGVCVEQMFYTLQVGMFYTLQAGLWRGDCGGNVLHLHLICANNDDKHAGPMGSGKGASPTGPTNAVARSASRQMRR